jgi:hypothetical protein
MWIKKNKLNILLYNYILFLIFYMFLLLITINQIKIKSKGI